MFGKNFEEKAKDAARELEGLGVRNASAVVDGKVVTLSGIAPDKDTKERAMTQFNSRVETENTINMIRVEEIPRPKAAPTVAPSSGAGPMGPPAPTHRVHQVIAGDTLSAIAKQYYGQAGDYPKIFEANRDVLKDPDKIHPGQKLRIP